MTSLCDSLRLNCLDEAGKSSEASHEPEVEDPEAEDPLDRLKAEIRSWS